MIVFQNPGELDPRLITVLGVNVKDQANGSPFGHFGTGLKYAIAVLLREGQGITIYTGNTKIALGRKTETIRGKKFQFIHMMTQVDYGCPDERELGFTTELGKNWTLEHAYRELHCNCLDEQGSGGEIVESIDEALSLHREGVVTIVVWGEEFHSVHLNRDKFLLSPKRTLVAKLAELEIYAGRSSHYYYKGVAVFKLPEPSSFLYNFTRTMALTEDRTLAQSYMADHYVEEALAGDPTVPEYVLEALFSDGSHEQKSLVFAYKQLHTDVRPRVERLIEVNPVGLNKSLMARYVETSGAEDGIKYTDYEPEPDIMERLGKAIQFCVALGFLITDYELRTVVSLGDRVLAMARKDQVLLSRHALDSMGQEELSATLIEEFLHLRHGVSDYTRQMQDKLFGEIVRVGQLYLSARGD